VSQTSLSMGVNVRPVFKTFGVEIIRSHVTVLSIKRPHCLIPYRNNLDLLTHLDLMILMSKY
jgi:hypothetical protein